MGTRSPGEPSTAKPLADRLDSWKEIASYLDRDVTTVQRWERREGMPVHRHQHDRSGSVFAFRAELDAWGLGRTLRAATENAAGAPAPVPEPTPPGSPRASNRRAWSLVAAGAALAIAAGLWLSRAELFWRSPLADGRFQVVTDFDGVEGAAAVSRDGRFLAFLSDRDGRTDVWVTQVRSGEFHNLTRGSVPELVNEAVRSLGFSPDASLVTFWARRGEATTAGDIGVWAVPTLGGPSRPYLDGAAEIDWSPDGSRLAYHTAAPGDPLFVTDGSRRPGDQPIHAAPAGQHAHFPTWAPDGAFLYFIQGALPDGLDIWRIRPTGGPAERLTSHRARISHPVLLNRRTLLYLASDPDGSGPWLHSLDVERRVPHRLASGSGLDRFTSLAASADGRRLVVTVARPKRTLWRLPSGAASAGLPEPTRIPLRTGSGFSPRLGPGYLLYFSATGTNESLWKLADGAATELWRGAETQVVGGPAIAPDGQRIAFSFRRGEETLLFAMKADGTNARVLCDSLELRGAPAWAPDGRSITSAAEDHGTPRLFRIPLDGSPPSPFVQEYSTDPAWAPDGRFVVFSGADIGTTFALRAVTPAAAPYPLQALTLTRGARHLTFLPRRHALVHLRGDIRHKDLWLVDLDTGAERQLTRLAADFSVGDFDVSPDGSEIVLERVQEGADVLLLDRSAR